ncbi:MAG: PRC-barrel domain-containing protein [Bacillota bacterium]|nr:PRC-barrel domain-containing protein [Bacillota bacterium]
MKGREICGLPVFSWQEGTLLGHVSQCYLNLKEGVMAGVVLEKSMTKGWHTLIPISEILKIYRDGIIVKSSDSPLETNQPGSGKMFCSDFLHRAELMFSEGEVLSDLVFNEKNQIEGGEISKGFWNDLSEGRSFRPWAELKKQIRVQKNGR